MLIGQGQLFRKMGHLLLKRQIGVNQLTGNLGKAVEGVFRIDFSAATLTELWLGTVIALIDGERRGRIPRAPLAQLAEQAFLQGIMRQDGTATA